MNDSTPKMPSAWLSALPLAVLAVLLYVVIRCFGGDSINGGSQIALLSATSVCVMLSIGVYRCRWSVLEEAIIDNIRASASAIIILLLIGAIAGTWMVSGVVPTLIYYGLQIIDPSIFLLVIFLFTALISITIGSSWTTVGTIGVAMLSTGEILGFHSGWLAGAIISGAYLGDKLSPLSDTTNLSSSVAGVDLYKHIRYLVITNLPTLILTAIIFAVAGFLIPTSSAIDVEQQCAQIKELFNISGWFLLIPAGTIFLIYKKMPPYITLFASAIAAVVMAVFCQPHIIEQISGNISDPLYKFIYVPFKILSSRIEIVADNPMLADLASTNGMAGVMDIIWLILCVVAFGGIMEAGNFITVITERMVKFMHSATSLVSSTIGTCIFCNIVLSDQYISILLPGKMFTNAYKKEGYAPELLSRSLQDSATVTSVLVPWNTCGVMQSTVLGVPTLTYLPYCFFNILSPIVSIIIVATGYKITRYGVKVKSIFNKNKNITNENSDK